MSKIFHLTSLEQLPETVQQFIQAMPEGTIYAFYGKMGAGKTTFIKELVKQLGSEDIVNSPTFAIVNEYECKPQPHTHQSSSIFHFDFYRINKIDEAIDMGYEEYFNSGSLCFIEWPELIEPLLPENVVQVLIEELPDHTRQITLN